MVIQSHNTGVAVAYLDKMRVKLDLRSSGGIQCKVVYLPCPGGFSLRYSCSQGASCSFEQLQNNYCEQMVVCFHGTGNNLVFRK